MTNRFRAIREESNRSFIKHQYKIVFEHNRNYVVGRMRFEPKAGWTVRCSECDQHLQHEVSAMLASMHPCATGLSFHSRYACAKFVTGVNECFVYANVASPGSSPRSDSCSCFSFVLKMRSKIPIVSIC